MGNQQEHEKNPTNPSKPKEKDGAAFLRELFGAESSGESGDENEISFAHFLRLANDLTAKWPQGTLEAWLLFKYKEQMVCSVVLTILVCWTCFSSHA
jgi:hypothetical protein